MSHQKSFKINLDRYKSVILDMDGVITRSAKVHAAAWKEIFDEYLQQRTSRQQTEFEPFDIKTDYERYVDGKPRYEGVQSFLQSRDISLPYGNPDDSPDKETVCGLGNRKNEYFLKRLETDGVDVYESSKAFVQTVKVQNKSVALISSSRNAKAVLDAAGVRDLFPVIVDGVEMAKENLNGKPDADIFIEAAKRLDVKPEEAVVIEDAIAGVKAGKTGGFALVIGIQRKGEKKELENNGADVVVRDLSELDLDEEKNGSRPRYAFDGKKEIWGKLRKGRPALFLEYDGVLAPITADPDTAALPHRTKGLLKTLSDYWNVVILTGRALDDVKNLVGLENLAYAGSHGLNIAGAGESFHKTVGKPFLSVLDKAAGELEKEIKALKGVRLERKPYALAVHYRSASQETASKLEKKVDTISGHYAGLIKSRGKKSFDLYPETDWNKGKALLYLLKKLHIDESCTIPIYIGDNRDEDVFEAIRDRGVGVLVGDGDEESAADYVVRDTNEVSIFLEELIHFAEKDSTADVWSLVYQAYEPEQEKLREALCTLGNGYIAGRGAAPETVAGENHYPGTYIAGLYNRLESTIDDTTVENESMVNLPNWLPLTFRIRDGDWFSPDSVNILNYRQELDMKRGILFRTIYFEDEKERRTRVVQRRIVHMSNRHLAATETSIRPENWSGSICLRSALDGRIGNNLVERYQQLNNQHLEPLGTGVHNDRSIWLEVQTNQSHIRVAAAARTDVFVDNKAVDPQRRHIEKEGYICQEFELDVRQKEDIRLEKTAAIYDSRTPAISESLLEAQAALVHAGTFADLLERHALFWEHLWKRWRIDIEAKNERVEQVLNLHIFHLLQTVSPNTIDLDVGVPPRGLHGEAYRGLIMWDELFIFPLLNLRMPDITRALLMYRYRRLPRACWAASDKNDKGAMFPWQSGSNGEEQAQRLHLNPASGHWIPDHSQLQRHINIAIAYNVWQYYQVTGDEDFLFFYGAELMILIARFWASKAVYNESLQRYEIRRVMGPDEFHDAYPDASEPGIDNNAYTNVMAAWVFWKTLYMLDELPQQRRLFIMEDLHIDKEELHLWEDISRKLRVPFHSDGIISQFEGYDELQEFDWEGYRGKYGNIQRLDRILESENDSPNRYKVSKQADVLMLFYLLSAEELHDLFDRLDYPFREETIPDNIDYYLDRTSHGSTLSRVVHAWVLSRSRREVSWSLFRDALESDINDIQGGTTPEGIHLGAMAGTVDLILRCYSGIENRRDILRFNPRLPSELKSLKFNVKYRWSSIDVEITADEIALHNRNRSQSIKVGLKDELFTLQAGEEKKLEF